MRERGQVASEEHASFRAPKRIMVPVDGSEYLADGSEVIAERMALFAGVMPSGTAYHESEHTVTAIKDGVGIKKVTIVPGPGYLGLTEPVSFSAVAAVAPHANGRDGTGHDLFVAEMMGADIGSASAAAKRIIAESEDHIEAVARHLQVNGTLTGNEVEAIMEDVDKGDKVDVTVKKPNGKVLVFPGLRTHESTVTIPGEWVVPQAA